MRPPRLRLLFALASLTVLAAPLAACTDTPGLGSCGASGQLCCQPGDACSGALVCQSGSCRSPDRSPVDISYRTKVDVLFLIDDSPSMEAMQKELQGRFPQFLQTFADLAKQGFYADLHLGVVTSDLGAGSAGTPSCQPGGGGRGAKFQALGKAASPDCMRPVGADYVQYVFGPSGDGPSNLPPGQSLQKTFTCMAQVGATGCPMEHVLEAAYQALKSPPSGFLREDAVLAVVFLTNEDDCSAPFDTDLFLESELARYGYFNSFRCTRFGVAHGSPPALFPYAASGGPLAMSVPAPNPGGMGPGKLWDVSRYVDFFTKAAAQGGLKADPGDVVLVGIDAPSSPAEVILADPASGTGTPFVTCNKLSDSGKPLCVPALAHSCQSPMSAQFFGDPAIRLNTVINAATHHSLASICDSDYSGALKNLGTQLASELGLGCIGARLPPDAQKPGQVVADCVVKDVTPGGGGSGEFVIPKCSTPATTFPCWRIEQKSGCAKKSPQSLGITIDRNGQPTPPSANIRASCFTI